MRAFFFFEKKKTICVQVYFIPDKTLSPIPFSALKIGTEYLIRKACIAQASSVGALNRAENTWNAVQNSAGDEALEVVLSDECR